MDKIISISYNNYLYITKENKTIIINAFKNLNKIIRLNNLNLPTVFIDYTIAQHGELDERYLYSRDKNILYLCKADKWFMKESISSGLLDYLFYELFNIPNNNLNDEQIKQAKVLYNRGIQGYIHNMIKGFASATVNYMIQQHNKNFEKENVNFIAKVNTIEFI